MKNWVMIEFSRSFTRLSRNQIEWFRPIILVKIFRIIPFNVLVPKKIWSSLVHQIKKGWIKIPKFLFGNVLTIHWTGINSSVTDCLSSNLKKIS